MAGVSALTLTAMDSGFMFTYAGGSFITGQFDFARHASFFEGMQAFFNSFDI